MFLVWILLLAVLIYMLAGIDHKLSVDTHYIETDRWAGGRSVRFVVISDLHSYWFGKDQQEILNRIREQQPNYILLPGDIVDDKRPIESAQVFLKGAVQIAPVFYVTGNHEQRIRRIDQVYAIIKNCGVHVLRDEFTALDMPNCPLVIAGIDDVEKKKRQDPLYDQDFAMEKAFAELENEDALRVLLAHRPERIERYKHYPFDLVVSGHAHGGQLRIPRLLNGLYASGQGLFPKYAGGRYDHDNLVHIVSRGVALHFKPRIYNPPEITVVHVTGKEK